MGCGTEYALLLRKRTSVNAIARFCRSLAGVSLTNSAPARIVDLQTIFIGVIGKDSIYINTRAFLTRLSAYRYSPRLLSNPLLGYICPFCLGSSESDITQDAVAQQLNEYEVYYLDGGKQKSI